MDREPPAAHAQAGRGRAYGNGTGNGVSMGIKKEFPIGAVLTVINDVLLEDPWPLLNHLTQTNLYTSSIGIALDLCIPPMRERFPGLAAISLPDFMAIDEEKRLAAAKNFVAEQAKIFGEKIEVESIEDDPRIRDYRKDYDPIKELIDMRKAAAAPKPEEAAAETAAETK